MIPIPENPFLDTMKHLQVQDVPERQKKTIISESLTDTKELNQKVRNWIKRYKNKYDIIRVAYGVKLDKKKRKFRRTANILYQEKEEG